MGIVKRGEGMLARINKSAVTDGVQDYLVISPRLLRLMNKERRDKTFTGEWMLVGQVIVYFKKHKTPGGN